MVLQAAPAAATERDDVWAHVPDAGHQHHHLHQHHFFMPHPQFLHGFSLLPGNPEVVAAHGNGSSASVAAGSGDEIALAVAAAAEAHAAGCMLPLSVFN